MNAALPLPPTLGELRDELGERRDELVDNRLTMTDAEFARALFAFELCVRDEVYAEVMRLTGRQQA